MHDKFEIIRARYEEESNQYRDLTIKSRLFFTAALATAGLTLFRIDQSIQNQIASYFAIAAAIALAICLYFLFRSLFLIEYDYMYPNEDVETIARSSVTLSDNEFYHLVTEKVATQTVVNARANVRREKQIANAVGVYFLSIALLATSILISAMDFHIDAKDKPRADSISRFRVLK